MADLPAIASGAAGGSTTMMAAAQRSEKALAGQLIKALEQSSQAVAAAAPSRVDTVSISPQAQRLYDASCGG